MKINKTAAKIIIVVSFIAIAAYAASIREGLKRRRELAERIFYQGNENPSDSLEELKATIASYEKRIERHVQDAARAASYWKILAIRLQDRGLHGEALDALENAIRYAPADPVLHYHTGVSAGTMAKSLHYFSGGDNIEREKYFVLAEEAFLRAIELDSRYLSPRYGLGVLYVFELDRPEDALVHLERCLEISRNDIDTMFVLARALYMLKSYQAAVDLYDRIITLTRDEQKRVDAQNNRQLVMGQMYG
jgi:tetratricopeptide (TPR) repeat protein